MQAIPPNLLTFGGGAAFISLVGWIILRQGKKIVEHVDRREIHLSPGTGYISADRCAEKVANMTEKLTGQEKALDRVHERLDHLLEAEKAGTVQILQAIQQLPKS